MKEDQKIWKDLDFADELGLLQRSMKKLSTLKSGITISMEKNILRFMIMVGIQGIC
ncbi:hypothetical protein ABW365_13720 [Enterococcus avium]